MPMMMMAMLKPVVPHGPVCVFASAVNMRINWMEIKQKFQDSIRLFTDPVGNRELSFARFLPAFAGIFVG